ncbi:MAG: polysaccharide biosynthesis tyrosine autokinase [Bacteroidota bacterium]
MNMETIVQIAPRNVARGSRSIEDILTESGMLSKEECSRILKLMQEDKKLSFGDAAIRLGLLSESDIQQALSQQVSYTYLPTSSKPVSEELLIAYEPFGPFAEELRAICSQLLLRRFDSEAKTRTLAIVSLLRGEGRSYLAANLAIAFSQFGRRTLLIDGDLREPEQHRLFNLENKKGLSSLLAGHDEKDAIVSIKAFTNLDVLPAGPSPANPLELLSRPAFGKILTQLNADYDVILFDTPAVSRGVEASLLAVRASAALVVARNNQTRLGAFGEMVKNLKRSGCAVIGSVFNDPPPGTSLRN